MILAVVIAFWAGTQVGMQRGLAAGLSAEDYFRRSSVTNDQVAKAILALGNVLAAKN